MKKILSDFIKKRDYELIAFILFALILSAYYCVRIFKYAPWYDELYTYYYFISNGPIYSAIHWPVPNNHIGYSVMSGIVYVITHNNYIALRGVSALAAISNLIFLFMICRKLMDKGFALMASALYSGMWLVNNLSVQGRGYTLATTMMLLCIYSFLNILLGNANKKYYFLWIVGLSGGFYIVTSSLYWVVPVCFMAGICLLLTNKVKELIRLIINSLYAAVITFALYLTVWLAIGSNLLISEETAFSGMGHVKMILSHPIMCAKRGIDYMLATPYIQSVSKEGYFEAFSNHWNTLLSQMYDYGFVLPIVLLISVIVAVIMVVSFGIYRAKHKIELCETDIKMLTGAIVSLSLIVMTPVVVMLQVKLPYYRVFSFYGIGISVAISYALYVFFGRLHKNLTYVFAILSLLFVFAQLSGVEYNSSYGAREEAALDIFKNNNCLAYNSFALTDYDVQYMYKFVYGIKNENTDVSNSDAFVISKQVFDENAEYSWENFYDFDSFPMQIVDDMKLTYENDYYLLYTKVQ